MWRMKPCKTSRRYWKITSSGPKTVSSNSLIIFLSLSVSKSLSTCGSGAPILECQQMRSWDLSQVKFLFTEMLPILPRLLTSTSLLWCSTRWSISKWRTLLCRATTSAGVSKQHLSKTTSALYNRGSVTFGNSEASSGNPS